MKQDIDAQSTVEAELIAATGPVNQVLWLRKIMYDLHFERKESSIILVNNKAV